MTSPQKINLTSIPGSDLSLTSLTGKRITLEERERRIYLNAVVVTGSVFLLWFLCVSLNTIILRRTPAFYKLRSPRFGHLIEFVATIDVIFCTVFLLYYLVSLVPGSLVVNQVPDTMCYEVRRTAGEWVFSVALTAVLVAFMRHTLLAMVYNEQENYKDHSERHKGRVSSFIAQLFSVQSWRNNSWGLVLVVLLLVGPWATTSAIVDQIPQTGENFHLAFGTCSPESNDDTNAVEHSFYRTEKSLDVPQSNFYEQVCSLQLTVCACACSAWLCGPFSCPSPCASLSRPSFSSRVGPTS